MSKVSIVTDSTAYLPKELLQQYNIKVVPLAVIWGMDSYEDGVDIQPDDFYKKLSTTKVSPTTSQATPANMMTAFNSCLEEGNEVFGMFISSKLSGTYQSAIQARDLLPSGQDKLNFFDSGSTSMGLGFQVLAVARAAAQGASVADCQALAEKALNNTGVYFVVDTLEYLHRGGRINTAKKFLGTALNLKPILTLADGKIEPVASVRTKSKAIERVIELIEEKTQGKSNVRLGTMHANAFEEAKATLDVAAERVGAIEKIYSTVSPAIGTHTGPGTIGLAYSVDL